jgi:2-octaprenyl-6-methoxyphenol hydroxylase
MDAVVVGGGLVGGTLALALAREGLDVALVEPEGAGAPGRAYALSVASRRLLAALGIWEGLPAQPILEVRVADGRPGEAPSPLHLRFHHGEIEEGPLGHMVEDAPLRAALDRALAGVHRVAGRVVAQGPGEVTLEDGARLRAAVVVGCDGRESGTAARAGIARDVKAYGQTAVTGAVHHARPHGGVAAQLFLPGGPLAVLPLTGTAPASSGASRTREPGRSRPPTTRASSGPSPPSWATTSAPSARWARAAPIPSSSAWRGALWASAWRWRATPPGSCTRSRGRGSTPG